MSNLHPIPHPRPRRSRALPLAAALAVVSIAATIALCIPRRPASNAAATTLTATPVAPTPVPPAPLPPAAAPEDPYDAVLRRLHAADPRDYPTRARLVGELMRHARTDRDLRAARALSDALRADADAANRARFDATRARAEAAIARGDTAAATPPEPKPDEPAPAKPVEPLTRPVPFASLELHDVKRIRHFFHAAVGPDPKTRADARKAIAWHGRSFPRPLADETDDLALLALAYAGDRRAASGLSDLLRSDDALLRANALEAAVAMKVIPRTTELEAHWKCDDPRVVLAAARFASRQSDTFAAALQSWTRSPHPAGRDLLAAYALALRDPRGPHLRTLWTAASSPDPRRAALAFRLLADVALGDGMPAGDRDDLERHARQVLASREQPSDLRLLAVGLLADADPRSRSIAEAIARCLESNTWGCENRAAVVLVVDDSLEPEHLRRLGRLYAWTLGRTALASAGALRVGAVALAEPPRDALDLTADPVAVWETLDAMSRAGTRSYRSTMLALRRAAATAAREPHAARHVVLHTLDNGDIEDDIEKTCAELVAAGARVFTASREAAFSDPYWKSGLVRGTTKGYELRDASGKTVTRTYAPHGPESAHVEFPFEWWFACEGHVDLALVPSGFAPYGLRRAAFVTGGENFLWAPSGGAASTFCELTRCPSCSGAHDACMPRYNDVRLLQLEPSALSRAQIARAAASDPVAVATRRAWTDASDAGLVTFAPSVLAADRVPLHLPSDERSPMERAGFAEARATQLAARTEEILKALDDALRDTPDAKTTARSRAMAETVHLYLWTSRLNTLELARECAERRKAGENWVAGSRFIARPARTMCHGAGDASPYGRRVDELIAKYRSTPWEVLVRRLVLLKYTLYVPDLIPGPLPPTAGKPGGGDDERERPSSDTDSAPTPGGRPPREGGGGSSSGGGTKGGSTTDK